MCWCNSDISRSCRYSADRYYNRISLKCSSCHIICNRKHRISNRLCQIRILCSNCERNNVACTDGSMILSLCSRDLLIDLIRSTFCLNRCILHSRSVVVIPCHICQHTSECIACRLHFDYIQTRCNTGNFCRRFRNSCCFRQINILDCLSYRLLTVDRTCCCISISPCNCCQCLKCHVI